MVIVLAVIIIWLIMLILCRIYAGYKKRKDNVRNTVTIDKSNNILDGEKIRKKNKMLRSGFTYVRKMGEPYLYGLTRYVSICIGKIPSHRIRKLLLKHVLLMQIHPDAIIYGGFEIRSPWNIKLGRVVVGVGAVLDGRNGIVMEDDVCLAQNVMIFTEQHDVNDEYFRCNNKGGTVYIKRHAWISSRTVILPKIVVGEGAVLASGAVATQDLEDFFVYGGIPAKIISKRKSNLIYQLGKTQNDYWHFY